MSRAKEQVPSIYSLLTDLSKLEIKPIYFLFGEDHFLINIAIKSIEKEASRFISSDFDREVITADKKESIINLIDLAYTFPFGTNKKILVVKSFENYNNKKQLNPYIQSPSDSTILVIANYGSISNLSSDPYKILIEKHFLYEAKELKGVELENWVKKRCGELQIGMSNENAKTIIEIVGEDKSLLEMQLIKIKDYLGDRKEITNDDIKNLSSATKEYSIFDLLNAIGKGDKIKSLKVIYNLLDSGKDMVFIISMLTKYLTVTAQSLELRQRGLNDFDASQAIGVSKYYYINCKNASFFRNENRILNAFNILFNADLTLKTTAIDSKTLATTLLTDILKD